MRQGKRFVLEQLEIRRLLSVSASVLFGSTTPGTKLFYETLQSGTVIDDSTQTIIGPATFNGQRAVEEDVTSSSVLPALDKAFFALDSAGNGVSFGSTGTSIEGAFTLTNTPAAIDFPATMNAGTTYTESWSTTEVFPGVNVTTSTVHKVELTSDTPVSVTVPAGTFSALLFNVSDTITESGVTESPDSKQEWIVPNKGLVKEVDGSNTEELIPKIVVGPAAKLAWDAQPLTGITGKPLTPALKVGVVDAIGNLVTTNTSTVKLSLESGPTGGTLTGTLSAAAVGGIATFTNVTATVSGKYVIMASDGTLGTVNSLTIGVSISTTPTQVQFIGEPQPAGNVVGTAILPVSVAIESSDGTILGDDSSTVTLSIASGPSGAVMGGTTSQNARRGIAAFSTLTFNLPGTYKLKATDGTLTSAVSTPFTVSAAGTASKVVFAGTPSTGTVGKALAGFAVDVESSANKIVVGNTSKVTLSIASGPSGATISGTTSVNATGGVAVFTNIILSKVGAYTLKATDGTLTSATSASINVTAAVVASKLVYLVASGTGAAGKALSPGLELAVESSGGTVINTDTSKVTLAIATGPSGGTVTGTLAVNASSGFAVFSNLIFSKPGTYTLKATDGTLTSATSGSVTITAGTAVKLVYLPAPVGTTAGKTLAAVKVEIVDSLGNVVTGNTSTVTLAIATGPSGATLGGTLSEKAAGGIATFSNLVLNKAGAYTLKATDGSLTAVTSSSFNITASTASKLVFSPGPLGTTAGKTLAAVKVDVVDAFGNIVTGNISTVTISIGSGPTGATLGGTLSEKAAAGVATFSNLLLNKAGTYTLKAADTGLTGVTSSSFSIGAGTAAKLVITVQPPTTATAGKALSPAVTVDVEDSLGNIVTSNTSTLTFAISSGPSGATLGGTLTAKAAAGVAKFSNLVLTKAGSYVLKVTDGSLTSALTHSVSVLAAAASKLVFTQQPTTNVHGSTLSPAVKVSIEDAFGNVALTNTTSVILALASGASGGVLSGTLTEKAIAGVATFSNLKLSKAGTYVIKGTDGSLTAGLSKSITVS